MSSTKKPAGSGPQTHRQPARRARSAWGAILAGCALAAGASAALANDGPPGGQSPEEMGFFPFAVLLLSQDTISLPFPSPGMPAPSSTLSFAVFGNVDATVTAEPNAFMQVGGKRLGKAVGGTGAVGYDVTVTLSSKDERWSSAPPGDMTSLPIHQVGARLRRGTLHVATDSEWTQPEGLPIPGTYAGQVTLTVAIDN